MGRAGGAGAADWHSRPLRANVEEAEARLRGIRRKSIKEAPVRKTKSNRGSLTGGRRRRRKEPLVGRPEEVAGAAEGLKSVFKHHQVDELMQRLRGADGRAAEGAI
ncbi:Hypothetical protein NTJ_01297 [Nesidiocoris tenuis]|uniref:Uncharacterized protein n=1 Tax=Nesidiocoris tenuis TaxID=355587 RepID=A0ABN7A8H2_9HEMI|nr:Hypothetical protein NTJ_01297 [Nesidiocoris tenuis]